MDPVSEFMIKVPDEQSLSPPKVLVSPQAVCILHRTSDVASLSIPFNLSFSMSQSHFLGRRLG